MPLRTSDHKLRRAYAVTKSARNEKIYRYFLQLLKEEGEKAPHLARSYYYEKIAVVFDICAENVGRVINWMTNTGEYKNFLTPQECEELLDARVKLAGK